MIFVAGTLSIDPGVVRDFQNDVSAMLAKVRAERGCRHYSLLVEDAQSGLINVLEKWDNDAALVAHLGQPWIVEFFTRYIGHVRESTVKVFDIAGERPLPGM
ncbi:MAG TPA: antibiotic biosynthesis monooxygenase family protein [Steroidobacteraceae bacterium]|nr:antibiotic biosynthesis monooxygenase family protein [Steroidobacteraceae bacterium]